MRYLNLCQTGDAPSSNSRFSQLRRRFRLGCALAYVAVFAADYAAGQASVLTQHNDIGRTGQNTSETILNTSNVNVSSFGKLYSLAVTGQVYAQPLYAPGVTINGVVHNVLIVATEEDYVYAFDADSSGVPLWTASMVDAAHGATAGESALPSATTTYCTDTQPYVGITGTPVIDPVSGTVYVEAKSMNQSSTFFHRLHALDITTGKERSQGPVRVNATVSGTGDGSNNGQLTFNDLSLQQNSRPGLLLMNGSVFIAYASHCDGGPYHGWLFAYNASTFAQQGVFITSPNGGLGGFWMSGAGIAADANGNIFIASGNGDFDTTNVPATELGDTVMKLSTTGGSFSLLDYFTPSDQSCLANDDTDLGSGGVLVLPDQTGTYPHLVAAAGKEGAIYILNRDQMTAGNNHFENSNNCITNDPQVLEESSSGAIGGMWAMPAYWNGSLYYWGAGDVLRSIPLISGLPSFTQWQSNSTNIGFPGATPSISSNGTTAGTAILWAVDSSQYGSPGPGPGPAILYAFDPTDINTELWDSTQAPGNRDAADLAVKFAVPTVVNGKVYVGGNSSVTVYGLLQTQAALTSPAPGTRLPGSTATFSWTPGAGVADYQLWLGNTGINSRNVFDSGSITTTSVTVNGLPTDGVNLYARLWSLINGVWGPRDYIYTEAGTSSKGSLKSPAPGSVLPGSSATFTWNPGSGPTLYELWLGTTGAGSSNVYNSGEVTTTSAKVTGIPIKGAKLYARLWSLINGSWQDTDYAYTEAAPPSPATLTAPAPGSRLSGSSATFSWTRGSEVAEYQLWLGTTGVNSSNIYKSSDLTTTSAKVAVIPTDGVDLYARLWSRINGVWEPEDSLYIEAGKPTLASLKTPPPGSVLAGSTVTFTWNPGAGPTQYELWLGKSKGSSSLYKSAELTTTSTTATGLPTNGAKIYARLFSRIDGNWQYADYSYTAK